MIDRNTLDHDRPDTGGPGPYAREAWTYRRAGWLGVLPVVGKSERLPTEFTGRYDRDPDDDQVAAWVATRGADNVALRVPDDVIGVDVDAYDGRTGLRTLEHFEERFGPLPRTWTSSSRTDGSGIRFHRVPADVTWVSDLGRDSDVQVVRRGHRYAVVWPSVHPKTGREYVWHDPAGLPSDRPPRPAELPELPPSWVAALRRGAVTRVGASSDGRDHRHDPVEVLDHEGERVDPHLLLVEGVAPGAQQAELFRYVCSLRARRAHRDEAVALGMVALQRLENADPADPWTPQHVVDLVDRVWREYPPGETLAVAPELRAFAERVAARSRAGRGDAHARVEVHEEPPREANATDLGNTLRFVALHRDHVRYAADVERWYAWDGRRWAPDATNRVLDLTKDVVDAVRAEALAATDRAEREAWLRWAHTSEALARREAIVKGARSEPTLVVTSDVFDRDPHLLVTRTGTVDLRTGEQRPSRPEDLCTQLAEVDLEPDAPASRWEAHVELLTAGDPVLAAYVRRAAGYTLTGDVGERAFFFLEGDGSNGKNAFIEPLMRVLGSYAQAASTALLTGDEVNQHSTILADLLGARLVFVDESKADRQLNVERVKALTGSKRIKARFIRQDYFEFDARFKLWIAGNGQPKVKDPSDGVWTRMHRVVCHGKVADDRKIKGYGDILYAEEASGILNWALTGLRDWWQLGGLGVPESVRADVQAYRDEEDYEAQFVEEYLVRTGDPGDAIPSPRVYRAYRHWAGEAGLKSGEVKNRVHLGRALSRLRLDVRVVKMDGRSTRAITGVRWAEGVNQVVVAGWS